MMIQFGFAGVCIYLIWQAYQGEIKRHNETQRKHEAKIEEVAEIHEENKQALSRMGERLDL